MSTKVHHHLLTIWYLLSYSTTSRLLVCRRSIGDTTYGGVVGIFAKLDNFRLDSYTKMHKRARLQSEHCTATTSSTSILPRPTFLALQFYSLTSDKEYDVEYGERCQRPSCSGRRPQHSLPPTCKRKISKGRTLNYSTSTTYWLLLIPNS